MNAHVTQFIEQAKSALSPAERFALAEAMLESVQEPADPKIEQARGRFRFKVLAFR